MDKLENFPESLGDPSKWHEGALKEMLDLKTSASCSPTAINGDLEDPAEVYRGSLKVEGNMFVSDRTLILGDLEVTGVISFSPAHNSLIVGGHLKAKSIFTCRSYLLVTGNAELQEVFQATAYSIFVFVNGLKAKLFLDDGSCSNLNLKKGPVTNITAKYSFLLDDSKETLNGLNSLLRPGLTGKDENGKVNTWNMQDEAEMGKPIFKDPI